MLQVSAFYNKSRSVIKVKFIQKFFFKTVYVLFLIFYSRDQVFLLKFYGDQVLFKGFTL